MSNRSISTTILIPRPSPLKKSKYKKQNFVGNLSFTGASVYSFKVLSKIIHPQVKILMNIFSQSWSQRILIRFLWLLYEKTSIFICLKDCKIISFYIGWFKASMVPRMFEVHFLIKLVRHARFLKKVKK